MGDESGKRRGILRMAGGAIRRTSTTQRLGAVGAVALLVTAPFGGLRAVGDPPADRLTLGQTVDVGPYDLTVEKVFTLPDLAPDLVPAEGNRLLAIRMTITNDTDEPQPVALLVDYGDNRIVYASGSGAVPFEGYDEVVPQLYNVADEREFGPSDVINPGLTYTVALVVEQDGAWQGGSLTLGLQEFVWETEAALALSSPRWVFTGRVWEGVVPVEAA